MVIIIIIDITIAIIFQTHNKAVKVRVVRPDRYDRTIACVCARPRGTTIGRILPINFA